MNIPMLEQAVEKIRQASHEDAQHIVELDNRIAVLEHIVEESIGLTAELARVVENSNRTVASITNNMIKLSELLAPSTFTRKGD